MIARFLLVAFLGLPFQAAAETVHFRSATWPATMLQERMMPLAQSIAETASVPLTGELYRPAGRGPFPAVVLLPPCSGRLPGPQEEADAARYRALGYALLVVDSLEPRGIRDGCSGAEAGGSIDLVMDAYGALLHLASLPFIDAERIAIAGYGKGAASVLAAIRYDGPERLYDHTFRAAIAYYPACDGADAMVAAPTLILMGEREEWARLDECRALMARHRSGRGAALRLVTYPDAHHAFNVDLPPRRFYGYPLEYNDAADRAAWAEAAALLRAAFGR
jgi:dienelactone hydrolase